MAAKKKKTGRKKGTRTPKKAKEIQLSAVDLESFAAQVQLINTNDTQLRMMRHSFDVWTGTLREHYGIRGRFEVDPQTGLVNELPE